jgi:glutamate/tyrosine decarboxylase-like PLP-dependent enzyme
VEVLRELRSDGLADLIDRTRKHAKTLVEELSRLDGVDVLCRPTINQGLVRSATIVRLKRIERLAAIGEAFFGPTTWRGVRAMSVRVLGWGTTERNVAQAVNAIRVALDPDATSRS